MRLVWLGWGVLGLGAAAYAFGDRAETPATTGPDARVPVVVELFTSEGCSSCPPADRVLARLAADQPVPTAQVIVLSEHVDYWNRLGWRDPFSSEAFSARQSAYDRAVFQSGQIYTPQMIVGGQLQLIGSDYPAALDAIRRVAAQPHAVALHLDVRPRGSGLDVHVRASPAAAAAIAHDVDVVVAITEDGLTRAVGAGENRGRTLSHTGVVRTLVPIGRLTPGVPALDTTTPVAAKPEWNLARVRVVAFAQEVETRRVLGAAAAPPS